MDQHRLARILWVVLAFAVWNVVFDRVLVLAGREYVYAATLAARDGVYLFAKDWMASAGAAIILATGLALVAVAGRRHTESQP